MLKLFNIMHKKDDVLKRSEPEQRASHQLITTLIAMKAAGNSTLCDEDRRRMEDWMIR